jgi:biotin carboxylase
VIDAFKYSKTNQIIIEEFMPGVEFTVEVFAFEGEILPVLITQKEKIQNGTGTVSGFLRAINPDHSFYSQIADLAVQAYSALGLRNGPGHLELIADLKSGPVGVVEAAARGGGFGLSTKLMLAVTGFDLIGETLRTFNGDSKFPNILKFKPGALFFVPSRKGRLIEIEGLAESRAIEGVDISVFAKIGSEYQEPVSDGDRLCAIVVTASSDEELDSKIQLIRERLRFVFDD